MEINREKFKLQIIYILCGILIIIPITMGASQVAYGEIVITISSQEETSGPAILLGEIARIKDTTSLQRKLLAELSLGDAPRPGYQRSINRQQIEAEIKEEGLLSEDYRLEMPALVTVRTRSINLAPEHMLAYIENYIKKKLPYSEDKIKIKTVFMPERIKIPDQMYTLDILEKNPDKLLGNITLPVLIKSGGQPWKKIHVGLEIRVIQEVFIARQNYIYGQQLQRDDFQKETKELKEIRGDLILDWDNPLVKNGITRVPLGKGEVLTTHFLKKGKKQSDLTVSENSKKIKIDNSQLKTVSVSSSNNETEEKDRPYVINWGNRIQAEVTAGKVTVSTVVKACGRGKKGQYITVENLKTGYRFQAQVISSQLVRIEL